MIVIADTSPLNYLVAWPNDNLFTSHTTSITAQLNHFPTVGLSPRGDPAALTSCGLCGQVRAGARTVSLSNFDWHFANGKVPPISLSAGSMGMPPVASLTFLKQSPHF